MDTPHRAIATIVEIFEPKPFPSNAKILLLLCIGEKQGSIEG